MKFPLGQLLTTPGAQEVVPDPSDIIRRHASGDWGTVSEEDWKLNDESLDNGGRLLSAYEVDGTKIWIITEADRSATTILLPEEY